MNIIGIFKLSNREKALDTLTEALEAGIIYNQDFKDLKGRVNGALERGYKIVDQIYLDDPTRFDDGYPQVVSDLYGYSAVPQMHTLNNRDKKIAKAEKTHADHVIVQMAREFLETVRPVINDMNTLKGLVVKGRKPSTEPRLTPERTLENTGTCSHPMCSMNVKLRKSGKITDHGYRIMWNSQQGNCFGVGYDPIEVSTEGLVAILKICKNGRKNLLKSLADLEAGPATLTENKKVSFAYNAPRKDFTYEKDTREYTELLTTKLYETKRDLKYCESDIDACQKRLDTWEAKPLPGAK